jgi:hypothetical protein
MEVTMKQQDREDMRSTLAEIGFLYFLLHVAKLWNWSMGRIERLRVPELPMRWLIFFTAIVEIYLEEVEGLRKPKPEKASK